MSTVTIADYVTDVYKHLGNITRDALPIETVLVNLHGELNKRVKQMGISEENYFLTSKEKSITDPKDQLVNIADFGTPVSVMLIDPTAPVDNLVEMPIEIVNFNALENVAATGRFACSFYGNPKRIRFSVPFAASTTWRLKIWYEPDTEIAKGLRATSPIPPQFRPLISLCTAWMCAPLAEMDETKRSELMAVMQTAIGSVDIDQSWENLWYKDVNGSKMYGNNRRTPYRTNVFRRYPRRF